MQPQVNLVNLTGKTLTFLAYTAKRFDIVDAPTESTNTVESNVLNLPEPKKDTVYIVTPDILCLCGNTRNDLFSYNLNSNGYVYNFYRGPFVGLN